MANSLFWKVAAAAAIVSALYIGHGLHVNSGGEPLTVLPAAQAEMVVKPSPSTVSYFITSSSDGKIVYTWRMDGTKIAPYGKPAKLQ